MKRKTLLIVGAGFGQLPAFEVAREMGLKILTIDRNPNALGMRLADASFEVDIIDKEAVLEVAKKNDINGIITLQSDHGVPAVGFVNDSLGLTGISYETALDCSYKTRFRKRLKLKNCSQPSFRFVSNVEEAEVAARRIGFPVVIKAADSSGSRGVTKINNQNEIAVGVKEAFKYSLKDQVIVEEYIDGIEFGAQTFSVKGKCEVVLLHNDTLSPPPYMVPIGHSFPFKGLKGDKLELAVFKVKEAVEAIGITSGPANVDLILDSKSEKIKVIEIGARIGATCLPELVYHHTGINWVRETILSAIGEEVEFNFNELHPIAAQVITANKDGIYKGYTIKKDLKPFNLLELEITAKPGEKISKFRMGTDRIGKVLALGTSVEEATGNVIEIVKSIDIRVDGE